MEDISATEESPRGSNRRSRIEVSYNESLADAELEAQLRVSEAAGRGKRNRKAVSYDHAYLTQDWDDGDLEEDEAIYQQRTLRRGRPALNVSLYEVNCYQSLHMCPVTCTPDIKHPAVLRIEDMMHSDLLHSPSIYDATFFSGNDSTGQRSSLRCLGLTLHRRWISQQAFCDTIIALAEAFRWWTNISSFPSPCVCLTGDGGGGYGAALAAARCRDSMGGGLHARAL